MDLSDNINTLMPRDKQTILASVSHVYNLTSWWRHRQREYRRIFTRRQQSKTQERTERTGRSIGKDTRMLECLVSWGVCVLFVLLHTSWSRACCDQCVAYVWSLHSTTPRHKHKLFCRVRCMLEAHWLEEMKSRFIYCKSRTKFSCALYFTNFATSVN